jgi:nitrate reductase (NAD(P)H)
VNAEILKADLFEPGKKSVGCGPPAMIQKAALPALKGTWTRYVTCLYSQEANLAPDWGYVEDENMFGF